MHLFDVDVPNGPVLMESRTTERGNHLVTVDTRSPPCGGGGNNGGGAAAASKRPKTEAAEGSGAASSGRGPALGLTLGLTTCYDMRFPEMYSLLRSAGAEVGLSCVCACEAGAALREERRQDL